MKIVKPGERQKEPLKMIGDGKCENCGCVIQLNEADILNPEQSSSTLVPCPTRHCGSTISVVVSRVEAHMLYRDGYRRDK